MLHKTKIQNRKRKQRKSVEKTRWVVDEQSNSRREERMRRFARDDDGRKPHQEACWFIDTVGEGTSDAVVGTSIDIEKSYFRLTSVILS